ncbi:hypothetical protein G6F32_017034 [Rhizopus arrhizus]|nr:hypothetical protein G6F32_017034 [Rhizopus arrhizus]
MTSVWPSGLARAVASSARLPPAPPRFSTITVCFKASAKCGCTVRARTSTRPPGASPTTSRTGLAGQA